jgi:hypothetical protein
MSIELNTSPREGFSYYIDFVQLITWLSLCTANLQQTNRSNKSTKTPDPAQDNHPHEVEQSRYDYRTYQIKEKIENEIPSKGKDKYQANKQGVRMLNMARTIPTK